MKKIFLLAKSNIRGEKGQTISFLAIMIIAILLFNIGVMTILNFGKTLENDAVKLNTEKIAILVSNTTGAQKVIDAVKTLDGVKDTEVDNVLCSSVSFDYSGGQMTNLGQFSRLSDETEIGKFEIIEEATDLPSDVHSVYVPYILKTGGGYELNDNINLTIDGETISYKIVGFFENLFQNSVNAYSLGFLLNDKEYDFLANKFGSNIEAVYIKALTTENANNAKLSSEISELGKQYVPQTEHTFTKYWEGIQYTRSFTAQMCSAMLLSLAVIIVIISLVVIRFRIQNSIDENIQNIGAMKALGYVSRQIIGGNVIQFVLVSSVALILGIALSYLVLPLLSGVFAMQTGIIWKQGFDIVSTAITVGVVLGATVLCTFISSRRIRKLNPITALRGGIVTHSFKKNYLPLERSRGNINFILAMKTAIQSIKQNLLIALIMAATTLCALTAFTMFLKISVNPDDFVVTLCGEMPDIMFTVKNSDDIDDAIEQISALDSSVTAIKYQTATFSLDGYTVYSYITDDFSKTKSNICYEGRNPEHDNEIALNGLLASKINRKIGDEVTVSCGDVSKSYILTGYIQTSNNYGSDAELTTAGAKRIDSNFAFTVGNVYTNTDVTELIAKIEGVGIEFVEVLDFGVRIASQFNTYLSINNVMMATILGVVLLTILLTFYLVIKTAIIRRKRDLGIQKAIGYTTRQLAMQLVTGFMPTVIVGCAVGGVFSAMLTNLIFSAIFSTLGIMRLEFTPTIEAIFAFCVAICLVTFIISLLVATRIRKVTAYSLIKEI